MTATANAGGIVLESYTGPRPEEAAKYLKPILEELKSHEYVAGYADVGKKFEAGVSRPAISEAGLPKTFKADVERGHDAWANGKFDDALKILMPLLEAARANPGQFVQDSGLRDVLQEALIAVALSRKGQGDLNGMNQAFLELVQSFAGATPGPNYGPEANRAFEALRKDMTGPRAGRIEVRLSGDQSLGVYMNEQLENIGPTRKAGIAPGEYRVLAKSARQMSRSHRVSVSTGSETSVTIDVDFDAAIHTGQDWTGLTFANAGDREQVEGAYAAQFASLIGAESVAVVGTEVVRGRTVIVGALINLKNGRDLRRATIALDSPPPEDRLRALAKFLTGEAPSRGIEVMTNGDGSGPPVPMARRAPGPAGSWGAGAQDAGAGGRWGGWKWIAGGVTAAAIGTGTVLVVLDGHCSAQPKMTTLKCPQQYKTLGSGLATLGGGAVLAGITVYLWLTGDPAAPAQTAYVVPTDGGAIAGFARAF